MSDITNSVISGLFGYYDNKSYCFSIPKRFNYGVRSEFPRSLTDQSYYIPNKRAVTGQNVSQSSVDTSLYDFPDGRINSSLLDSVVDLRDSRLDIVERMSLAKQSIKVTEKIVQDDVNRVISEKAKKVLKDQKIEDVVRKVANII